MPVRCAVINGIGLGDYVKFSMDERNRVGQIVAMKLFVKDFLNADQLDIAAGGAIVRAEFKNNQFVEIGTDTEIAMERIYGM